MNLSNPEGVSLDVLDVNKLGEHVVVQSVAVAMAAQEAMYACFKARVAFYRAGAELCFSVAQAVLTPSKE